MYLLQNLIFRGICPVLLSLMIFSGCKSTAAADKNIKIATEILGEHIDTYPNSTGEFILYIEQPGTKTSPYLKFLVIRTADHQIVHQQSFNPGHVKWITDSSIEVLNVPGTIRENQSLADFKNIITLKPEKD